MIVNKFNAIVIFFLHRTNYVYLTSKSSKQCQLNCSVLQSNLAARKR